MQKLAKAVLKVMEEVKGIDKTMVVGTGQSSYKGVPDQEVKKIIGQAMQKNGLVLLPVEVDPRTTISTWEEEWNGQKKRKQSVFTEIRTKYLLLHESGESMEVVGYGHGVDSQDKSAGKATTYALKYLLLYTFLVPTGKIDDADNTHSNDIEIPEPKKQPVVNTKAKIDDERFKKAIKSIEDGKYSVDALKTTFTLTKSQENELKEIEQVLIEEKVHEDASKK